MVLFFGFIKYVLRERERSKAQAEQEDPIKRKVSQPKALRGAKTWKDGEWEMEPMPSYKGTSWVG